MIVKTSCSYCKNVLYTEMLIYDTGPGVCFCSNECKEKDNTLQLNRFRYMKIEKIVNRFKKIINKYEI